MPIFYALFTSPFSPMLAPLSISNSFSISCTCLISLFSPISQLSLNFKTPGYAKSSINLAKIMVESSMNNTKKSKPILLNSNTSKESIPVSILICFYIVMPYSGAPKTLFFEGSNVTNFFDQYNQMCINY